jgi:hypothetical protein
MKLFRVNVQRFASECISCCDTKKKKKTGLLKSSPTNNRAYYLQFIVEEANLYSAPEQ